MKTTSKTFNEAWRRAFDKSWNEYITARAYRDSLDHESKCLYHEVISNMEYTMEMMFPEYVEVDIYGDLIRI